MASAVVVAPYAPLGHSVAGSHKLKGDIAAAVTTADFKTKSHSGGDAPSSWSAPVITPTDTSDRGGSGQQGEEENQGGEDPPEGQNQDGGVSDGDSEDDDDDDEEVEVVEEEEEHEAAAKIRAHQRKIQAVIRFWFGQYAPDQAAKKLWNVAAQNVMRRQQVDQEISEQFGQMLVDLTAVDDQTWNQWCYDSELYGINGKIAAIVILDQFSRHITRYQSEATGVVLASDEMQFLTKLPPQTAMDHMAFKTAQLLVDEHAMEIASGMIPLPMFIFSLMPFRHAKMLETVEYVQMQIEGVAELHQENDAMLRRFRKATNRRLAVLQDDSRRSGTGKSEFSESDILEHVGFAPPNIQEAVGHATHQAIRAFLEEQGVNMVPEGANGEHPTTPVIISLSGGVDSMVIAAVCSHLVSSGKYKLNLKAVHIDYANRPESAAEAAFVESYCKQLGIAYQCRRIDEVTRGETSRDEYEQVSRTARYDFYRQAVKECQGQSGCTEVGVVLGHHRGDLRENVLSNAHKGSGPLDLSGMTAVSKNDGVTLYRPLLALEKTDVYEYAHKFGVPYFKDTTPQWSTRGKLRNQLLPLLEEIYGEGSMNNLSHLAVESDECRALMQQTVMGPFLSQVKFNPMGISFDTAPWKTQKHFFWKFVLRESLHSASMGMFTDKSVESFMGRMQADNIKQGWLQCRKDCGVYLREDGRVFVLQPYTFPWRPAESYETEGKSVGYGESVELGPWCVSAVMEEADQADKLALKAVDGIEGLMAGSIDYYLKVPTWEKGGKYEPRPLVFATFAKASRPRAWKNVDIKIQEVLPLLGNDAASVKALEDPEGCGAVHTNTAGEQVGNPTRLVKVTLRLSATSA